MVFLAVRRCSRPSETWCCTGCCSPPLRPGVPSAVPSTPVLNSGGRLRHSRLAGRIHPPVLLQSALRSRSLHRHGTAVTWSPRVGRERRHRRGPPTRPRPRPRLLVPARLAPPRRRPARVGQPMTAGSSRPVRSKRRTAGPVATPGLPGRRAPARTHRAQLPAARNLCTNSALMRPRALTSMPCPAAHARHPRTSPTHRGRVTRSTSASTPARSAVCRWSPSAQPQRTEKVLSACSARAAQPTMPIQEVLPAITAPTTSSSTE